jgi:hypothetical protein
MRDIQRGSQQAVDDAVLCLVTICAFTQLVDLAFTGIEGQRRVMSVPVPDPLIMRRVLKNAHSLLGAMKRVYILHLSSLIRPPFHLLVSLDRSLFLLPPRSTSFFKGPFEDSRFSPTLSLRNGKNHHRDRPHYRLDIIVPVPYRLSNHFPQWCSGSISM